ncbi:YcnI family protein [Microbispora rosea]|uniref:YcnI family copper-binding membrane protein n=1 Tax=Microbispora rosea TaxID=58117 RepID=UPI0018CC056F|nr:YcnI family protein [Microbispora rosea]
MPARPGQAGAVRRRASRTPRTPRTVRALRRAARGLVVAAVAACLVAVLPAAAFAHVKVTADTAVQGGYAALTFRVPNERDDASTTKIEVQLPVDFPLASVSVKPHPGWSYAIEKTTLATPIESHGAKIGEVASKITWTASGEDSGIKPGEYDEFSVSAGPLPETDRLTFKTLQHYSDGEVVRWIQEQSGRDGEQSDGDGEQSGGDGEQSGGDGEQSDGDGEQSGGDEEPERPAPVLGLTAKGAAVPGPAPAAGSAAGSAAVVSESGTDAGVAWAIGLSAASLVICLGCAAALALRWRRTG